MDTKILSLKILQNRLTACHLETVLATLDRIHEATATDTLDAVSNLSAEEVVGWLEDIIYTAQETLKEMGVETPSTTVDATLEAPHPAQLSLYGSR